MTDHLHPKILLFGCLFVIIIYWPVLPIDLFGYLALAVHTNNI